MGSVYTPPCETTFVIKVVEEYVRNVILAMEEDDDALAALKETAWERLTSPRSRSSFADVEQGLPAGDGLPPKARSQRRVSIRLVDKSYDVVTGRIPPHLLEDLKRDFTADEKEEIYARVGKRLAPSCSDDQRPIALWVLGPSAVGKSFITAAKAAALFQSTYNAVVVDGAEFREVHAGWKAVAVHGLENGLLHADAWKLFKAVGTESGGKGISGQLKQELLQAAMRDRNNLIIPDCANDLPKLQKTMRQLIDAGYEQHAVCLWAPLSETEKRGQPRSVTEGKLWSGKDYTKSTQSVLLVAKEFNEGMTTRPDVYKGVELWDNTIFPAVRSSLTRTHAHTDAHSRSH